jgi:aminoglycoside phosphotransferase (APT) family kinase protein
LGDLPSPAAFGPDVEAALRGLPVTVVTTETIGGWRAGRTTLRVTLADGSVVKARQLTPRAKVARAAALTTAIADPRLPAPIAVFGRVAVERWIEGTPLPPGPVPVRHLQAAADLLGSLHARTEVPGVRFQRRRLTARVALRCTEQLAVLAEAGVVDEPDRRRLVATVAAGLPPSAERGVVHGDLRRENLVVTPAGELVSVDNEAVRIDFLDYDLALTWCRWPMNVDTWTRFVSRYARWGRAAPGPGVAAAWRVVAAVHGAHRWHRAHRARSDEPLEALHRVVTQCA